MNENGGTIITFYSYKGGTGRSMGLANIAWILASNGKRVLVWTGTSRRPACTVISPFLSDKELRPAGGDRPRQGLRDRGDNTIPREKAKGISTRYTARQHPALCESRSEWKFPGEGRSTSYPPAGRRSLLRQGQHVRLAGFL